MLRGMMQPTPQRLRVLTLTVLATLTLWLGQGCTRINNDRMTVGGQAMHGLSGSVDNRAAGGLIDAREKSISSLDRSGWPPLAYDVRGDGTQHHPRYTNNQPAYDRTTARARGEHPDEHTALTVGGDAGMQTLEAWAAPLHAGLDVILFVPRMFFHPPGSVVESPDFPYERTRRTEE